ncbi:MAG TPA: Rid family hydrolase, partial [Solirubrobacterales bacterium]|nr:Rid family hydrolase [Solirubrobacterales bacterium]
MGERWRIGSGAVWEERFGYSRAVKAGPLIFVSGTTAADPTGGPPIGGDDIAAQARECFRRIEVALGELGSGLGEVVRTRMFVTDIGLSEAVGLVHGEIFGRQ